jgi:hypothetical protein
MKKFIMCAVLMLAAVSVSNAQITSKHIDNALNKNLSHPYLFFTEEEKPAILDRIENDPESRHIMERILSECSRWLYWEVESPLPEQLRDSRFDTSGKFLGVYSNYRRATLTLAFAYQMTGDMRYAEKSMEFAGALCDMDTWVMRACQYEKAYPRVSPWNVPDDKAVFTFAILASDTASELSMVYDWLYPVLTKTQRDRIRGALLEKAIIQVRGNYEFHWWATAYRCNWCAWCNTGLGLAALTLIGDHPQLSDVIAESYNRISLTLSELGEQGGWQEGGSYWSQTLRMSTLFADALKRATGGKYNHFKHPKIAAMPVNFPLYISAPPDYRHSDFADAHFNRLGSPRLYNKLALETGSPEAAWIRDNWFGEGNDMFDIIWPRHTVNGSLPGEASMHFSTIDWMMMRSDFTDPEKVMVACKAGKNDDPHHGHLDVGQFMVYWRGHEFIKDLGTATYDEKYFDAEKYDTPHAASRGHNIIIVNGEQQIPGKLKDTPVDEAVGGEVIGFRTDSTRDYTLMDCTNAYPKNELKSWRRHIVLDKPEITVVLDEVESHSAGPEIEARFHSDFTQQIRDGYAILDSGDGMMALIPVMEDDWEFRPDMHAYLGLQMNARFEWIPFNGTVVNPDGRSSVLAHVILPVADESEAAAVARSVSREKNADSDVVISFAKAGRSHSYVFKNRKGGLVLE